MGLLGLEEQRGLCNVVSGECWWRLLANYFAYLERISIGLRFIEHVFSIDCFGCMDHLC